MKKIIVMCYFLLCQLLIGQIPVIDKVNELKDVVAYRQEVFGSGPKTISINEVYNELAIIEGTRDKSNIVIMGSEISLKRVAFEGTDVKMIYSIKDYLIGFSERCILIRKNTKRVLFLESRDMINTGISFILKNPPQYVAFFVNEKGEPHAADTSGKIYDSAQTMALLKALDPEKYRQSLLRAEELGMEEQFLANKVLVWGRTYYSTPRKVKEYWGRVVFPDTSMQIQYDVQGNGYMATIYSKDVGGAEIWILDPNAEYLAKIDITDSSKILSTYKRGQLFTSSTYVGFGGNIYFYVTGEAFTEVFRIRRTWGEPDFYAMAVNGYTEDAYGIYVKKVLKDLSKEDLRLLRNHLYALYGYVFKDSGLKSYFDKLVWYESDPAATMESIKLPAERQALLEMILAEEKR